MEVDNETGAALDVRIDRGISGGPFEAQWPSLQNYHVPAWYEDGKFGIFIHWGVYAVPAFKNEWYPREMYQQGSSCFEHHIATYGPQTDFGYKDFIKDFRAENYDPDAWVALFKEAGAKFVVPVAEHHDGFPMYDTALSGWSAAQMGPKRDLIAPLSDAVRAAGLVFGLSSHRAEHWFFFDGGRQFPSDVQDPTYEDFYGPAQPKPKNNHDISAPEAPNDAFMTDWQRRTCELVEKFHPQIVWFDWWIEHKAWEPYLRRFAAFYYNEAQKWGDWDKNGAAINYKYSAFVEGSAVFDIERGQLSGIRPMLWQNDTSVSRSSWGYTENQDYKTVDSLIDDLVDIVSKNGALLLNVGPKPDGTIPGEEQALLREIGAWLQINGAAIYHTRPWKVFGEGPTEVVEGAFTDTKRQEFTGADIRFTRAKDDSALYAIALAWPGGGTMTIKSLGTDAGLYSGEITSVRLLGGEAPLAFVREADALRITLPTTPPGDHAYAVEIK